MRDENGSILILAVCLCAVLFLFASSIAIYSISSIREAVFMKDYQSALYLGEAGINQKLYELNQEPSGASVPVLIQLFKDEEMIDRQMEVSIAEALFKICLNDLGSSFSESFNAIKPQVVGELVVETDSDTWKKWWAVRVDAQNSKYTSSSVVEDVVAHHVLEFSHEKTPWVVMQGVCVERHGFLTLVPSIWREFEKADSEAGEKVNEILGRE